jgi:hypothetical protein
MVSAEQLVLDLCDPELRENALLDLSKVALLPPPTLQLSPQRGVSLYSVHISVAGKFRFFSPLLQV